MTKQQQETAIGMHARGLRVETIAELLHTSELAVKNLLIENQQEATGGYMPTEVAEKIVTLREALERADQALRRIGEQVKAEREAITDALDVLCVEPDAAPAPGCGRPR